MLKGEELGSGAFGQVLQGGKLIGLEKTKTGKLIEEKEEVAIKILQRYTNELSEKNFLNEIHTMKLINGHKNIVKMIGCITVGDRICLVLEFCPYRDLLQYSKTKKAELDPLFPTFDHITKEFLIFAWQISNGMQYLASEGIIHRDLAARNILINEFKVAKISDFGLSVKINDKLKNSISKNILQIETGKLPLKWLAIESLKNYEFSLKSDIWSFGIVLYEMFTFGETPFSEIENSQLLEYLEVGNRPEKPEICSDEIYELMLKCWNDIPTLRPGFDELITFFTIFLEHSTENYGYLDVIKSGKEDSKELKRIIYPKISNEKRDRGLEINAY
uniref:Protein kinase domain-containing protein n=1 Tax=Panagrolaimus davidi TaxID=227884 RepID=A0A914PDQ7_9BILA